LYQQYRLSGLYNTGAPGNAVALNRSYPGNSNSSGVTIITPRASGRSARSPVKVTSNAKSTTYLTPTGDRVIIGNSSGSRNSVRASTQFVGNN
jgi:hypothetical protein